MNTYELGLKTSFHGSIPVILNVAAFYNDFHKMQLLGTFVAVPNVNNIQPNSGIVNAGSSRIYGLEADSTISLTDDLKIGLGYAYLNSKLTKVNATIQNPVYNVFGAGAPPGGRLSLTPNHRFTATVTYHLPVDESLGEISAGATYVYTSSQFVYEPAFPTGPGGKLVYLTSPYANLKSTSLLNLNVNWESIGGRPVDAEFFMTNVMNLHYSVYNDNLGALFGPYSKVWGPPRMFGGRLRYHF